ncbi:MAG TPA: hypothetical protein VN877_03010 [Opitutaceae bacterium]|nr:hypothetical protein [Opitutaceae bacterium]
MKTAACILLLAASVARGVSVGETYQQVVAEKGNPTSSINAGSMRMLNYPDLMIKVKDGLVVSVTAVAAKPAPTPPPGNPTPTPISPTAANIPQIYALANRVNAGVARVVAIINQPIDHLQRKPGMKIMLFTPPWFRPGSIRPDFSFVDITAFQEVPYAQYEYVSSSMNPDEAFLGAELEFNPMTKYFYTDLTIPKKRLTRDQMNEINSLYRMIGQCELKLIKLGYSGKMP